MLNRRESREAVFGLLFENEFGLYEDKNELYETALAARELGGDYSWKKMNI